MLASGSQLGAGKAGTTATVALRPCRASASKNRSSTVLTLVAPKSSYRKTCSTSIRWRQRRLSLGGLRSDPPDTVSIEFLGDGGYAIEGVRIVRPAVGPFVARPRRQRGAPNKAPHRPGHGKRNPPTIKTARRPPDGRQRTTSSCGPRQRLLQQAFPDLEDHVRTVAFVDDALGLRGDLNSATGIPGEYFSRPSRPFDVTHVEE